MGRINRWRCMWPNCPVYGRWQASADPVAAGNRHYLRHHWNPQRQA